MYQTQKVVDMHTKAIASLNALSQMTLENTKAINEIHFEASKDAMQTIQSKMDTMSKIKDLNETLSIMTPEEAQSAVAEILVMQGKVAKVFGKSKTSMIAMLESAIDDTQAELKQTAKELSDMAPVGSAPWVTAFDYVFDAAIQGFDQAYVLSKDAYLSYEKSIENAMDIFHGELTPSKKVTTKKMKAIAA